MEIAFVTFTSALPLSLVEHWDVARDAALLGWMLTTFYLSAALSGVATGALGRWIERRFLVAGSMLLTPVPLLADFTLEPGGAPYFLTVALAGALTNAAFPLLVVSAHDLAPYAVGTASGMLMGLLVGAAGLLYVGIGWLQERIGMGAAMGGVTSPDSGGDPVLRGFDEASRWEGHASSESFVTRSSVGEGPPIV